mmetsp:Transcript_14932/g.43495  ORF Transcript_14932/g.43495 Transcript_14932/m.43495 type:complete len:493 (-) Transcript_14932:52-1530(-)
MNQNATWNLSPPPAKKDAINALYKSGLYGGDSFGRNLRRAAASFDCVASQRQRSARSFALGTESASGGDISNPTKSNFGLTIRRFSKPKAMESFTDGLKSECTSAKSFANLCEAESGGIMSMVRSGNFKPVMNPKNANEAKHGFSWPSKHHSDALSTSRRHSADSHSIKSCSAPRNRIVGDYYEPILQTNFRAAIRQGCYSSPSLEDAVHEKRMKSRRLSGSDLRRDSLTQSGRNGRTNDAASTPSTRSGGMRRNRVSASGLTKLAGKAIVNAVKSNSQSDGKDRVQPVAKKSASMSHLPSMPSLGEFAVDRSRSSMTSSYLSLTSSMGGATNLRGLLVENREQLSCRGGWEQHSSALASFDRSSAGAAKHSCIEEEKEPATCVEVDMKDKGVISVQKKVLFPTQMHTSSAEKRDALKKASMDAIDAQAIMDDDSTFEGEKSDDETQHSVDDVGWKEGTPNHVSDDFDDVGWIERKQMHAFDDFGWTSHSTL